MKTLYSHDQFVPSEVKALVGDEKWRALIKMEPKDFIVEERTTPAHLCTTGEESDLDANRETISGKPGLVGVTVISAALPPTRSPTPSPSNSVSPLTASPTPVSRTTRRRRAAASSSTGCTSTTWWRFAAGSSATTPAAGTG